MANQRIQRLLDSRLPEAGGKETTEEIKKKIVELLKDNGFSQTARVIRGMSLDEVKDWLVNEIYG